MSVVAATDRAPGRRPSGATSTADQVADRLRDDIVCGALGRGRPLREESIAATYQVSRRSARDALRILEGDGLVRHQRHRGSTVADLTAEDVRDLYAARRVVELAAVRRCSDPGVRESASFSAFTDAIADLRQATEQEDRRRIVQADIRFHVAIVGLLGSPRLERCYASLASEMGFAIAILEAFEKRGAADRPAESLAEHQAIYDALATGAVRAAERLLSQHLDSSSATLSAAVEAPLL